MRLSYNARKSIRYSMATAHSRTARRRWRTRLAVATFRCQRGVRISSTSALVTSETGTLPMRGKANRLRLDSHSRECLGVRHPPCFCSSTRMAASGEGGDALGASFLSERVSAMAGELAVGERLLPSLGQGNEDNAAESELTAAAADEKALNPAAGSARLNEQVQSVPVGVSSGRSGANEGRREGLLGWRPLGLVLGSRLAVCDPAIIP